MFKNFIETVTRDYSRCLFYTDEDVFAFSRLRLFWGIVSSFLFDKGFRAVFLYRLNSSVRLRGRYLRAFVRILEVNLTRVEIDPTAEIGAGLFIPHAQCIVIGSKATIGKNVTVYQGVTIGAMPREGGDGSLCATIGDNVMIGAGSVILGSVTIGKNSIVGANAVVLTDIPDDSVCVGIPAKVVKTVTVPYHERLSTTLK